MKPTNGNNGAVSPQRHSSKSDKSSCVKSLREKFTPVQSLHEVDVSAGLSSLGKSYNIVSCRPTSGRHGEFQMLFDKSSSTLIPVERDTCPQRRSV